MDYGQEVMDIAENVLVGSVQINEWKQNMALTSHIVASAYERVSTLLSRTSSVRWFPKSWKGNHTKIYIDVEQHLTWRMTDDWGIKFECTDDAEDGNHVFTFEMTRQQKSTVTCQTSYEMVQKVYRSFKKFIGVISVDIPELLEELEPFMEAAKVRAADRK
jgi:hypothetical protein